MAWIPIRYRDFFDIPRAFLAERDGVTFLFDCPFDEVTDTYPDSYRVYRLAPGAADGLGEGSWQGLEQRGTFVTEIATQAVRFDSTRRAAVDALVLNDL